MNSFEKIPLETKGETKSEKPFSQDPLIDKLERAGLSPELIKEVEERLKDALTHLPRSETAKAAINELIKAGKNVVLEFDDLMFLKVFNKTIGFEETNEMLRKIGEIYRKEVEEFNKKGEKIMVCRYGGDEFLIIVGERSKEEAQEIFEEIQRALREIKKPEKAPFGPKFSRGIASLEELSPEERSFKNLIELADKRVNETKQNFQEKLRERGERTPEESYQVTKELIKKIKRYSV